MINKDFDDFNSELGGVIEEIRDEMKFQYHRFVQLEMKISLLCNKFIDLQVKYGMDAVSEPEEKE